MSHESNKKSIELFVRCRDLVGLYEKSYDVFLVVMIKRTTDGAFEEVQRTETLSNDAYPRFCTSVVVDYDESSEYSPKLRFDIYERKTVDTERLRDHKHRGTACAHVADLVDARGNQLTLLLHHPTEPRNAGTIFVAMEEVDMSHPENASVVQIDVSVSVLRRRDLYKTLVSQRYELCRAHRYEDEGGCIVWLPVYRSDRIARQRDSTSLIEFSTASISYRHLCNADEERNMRLVLYGIPQTVGKTGVGVGGNKKSEYLLARAEFTLRFICEMDPTEEVLGLEKDGAVENIGNVSILKAEPTDYGSHFALQVNYEHTSKYTSAGSDERKGNTKRLTRLKIVSKKSFTGKIRSEPKSLSSLSMVNDLFSNNSLESDNSYSEEE